MAFSGHHPLGRHRPHDDDAQGKRSGTPGHPVCRVGVRSVKRLSAADQRHLNRGFAAPHATYDVDAAPAVEFVACRSESMAIGALGIGLAALQSYQLALNVTANNIANANTNGFVPARADFHAAAGGAGVFATISQQGAAASSTQPSETD